MLFGRLGQGILLGTGWYGRMLLGLPALVCSGQATGELWVLRFAHLQAISTLASLFSRQDEKVDHFFDNVFYFDKMNHVYSTLLA
jgi:hypothetical protein